MSNHRTSRGIKVPRTRKVQPGPGQRTCDVMWCDVSTLLVLGKKNKKKKVSWSYPSQLASQFPWQQAPCAPDLFLTSTKDVFLVHFFSIHLFGWLIALRRIVQNLQNRFSWNRVALEKEKKKNLTIWSGSKSHCGNLITWWEFIFLSHHKIQRLALDEVCDQRCHTS